MIKFCIRLPSRLGEFSDTGFGRKPLIEKYLNHAPSIPSASGVAFGYCDHWKTLQLDALDSQFECLLFENANWRFRPEAVLGALGKQTFEV